MSFGGHWIWIILLLVVVLIIWGPGKLPDVGAGLGRAIREFRKASQETRDDIQGAFRDERPDPTAPESAVRPAPAAPPYPAPSGGGTVTSEPARDAGSGDAAQRTD